MKSIFVRIFLIPVVVLLGASFLFYVWYVRSGPLLLDGFLSFIGILLGLLVPVSMLLAYRTTNHITRPLRSLVRKMRAESDQPAASAPEGRLAESSESGVYEIREIERQAHTYLQRMKDQLHDLNLERELLRSLLNGLQEGVMCIDSGGTIVFMNERMDESLLDAKATSNRYFSRIRHPVLLEYVQRLLNDSLDLRTGDGASPSQIPDATLLESGDLEFRSGEKFFRLRHRPAGGDRESVLFLVFVQDVTEEYGTRRLREDFLQNASHELKTPITSIRGYAETLLPRMQDETQQRFLEGIVRNAERMDHLVHDMVVISSLESRAYPFSVEKIDPVAFFEQLRLLVEGTLSQKHQRMSVSIDETIDHMAADSLLLEHLFVNLVGNASRYSPEGSVITISMERSDRNRIEIRVMDQGPGIPEEFREKIFERFFRIDQDRSRKEGGTGLGLSIVRHVVRLHSGSIRVEEAPGGGASFVVVLPVADRF